ncbi:transcriptional regulator [Lentilactobacillus buchneri]|uniref:winged helix-turn-helix transcriptional regulator n=1 Tax=Lentilactobacillus buchneri TaxID=1581 RepID=UPI0021A851E9|nr:helix-turn-helix domain-containing protein [Lentilactobacillus buchneri]MCT3543683.1 transcriptional regulator [Lentilactobacillus buchneri]
MTDSVREAVQEKLANGIFNCPKELTLSMISGKWKINILYHLGTDGPYYFYELQKLLPAASRKAITAKLKELVEDGLVNRKPLKTVPVKVQYSITPLGKSLMPIIDAMLKWGQQRLDDLQLGQVEFGLGKVKHE